jgi:hypothetical protein
MRVRCIKDGSTFDVPDDMVGMKVQCPQCGHQQFVGSKTDQVQAHPPVPKPSVPANLENQIYDGLPPLSVMIALRRGKGPSYDEDDLLQRFPMTEDDWKALAAFEAVLYALASLQLSLILVPIAAAAVILITLLGMARDQLPLGVMPGAMGCVFLPMVGVLTLCWITMFRGRNALGRIEPESPADLLLWTIAGMIAVFGVVIWLQAQQLGMQSADDGGALVHLLGLSLNVLAIFDLIRSAIRVWHALGQIHPPEITSRLVEALKYLE